MIEIQGNEVENKAYDVNTSADVNDDIDTEAVSEETVDDESETEMTDEVKDEKTESEKPSEETTEETENVSAEKTEEEKCGEKETREEKTEKEPEPENTEEESKEAETGKAEATEKEAEPEKTEEENKESGETKTEEPQKPEKKERGLKWAKGAKAKKEAEEEKLKSQVAEINDKYVRLFAEFDNFRNRTEKEKTQRYDMGARTVIEKILPVIDNFERGFAAVEEADREDAFVKGMDLVYKQFEKALEDLGVKPIEAVGQPFNPDLHNAVMHVDDPEVGENIVVEEFQKGYMYKDQVVRYSMVKVAN